MGKYLVKRIVLLIPTLILVCLVVFVMMRCLPGGAVEALLYKLQAAGDTTATTESVQRMLGLDQPAIKQFFVWLWGVVRGDLGNCFFQNETVSHCIGRQIVPSLELGFLILVISNLISIPLGVFCAAHQDSVSDHTIRVVSLLLMSIPVFWIATIGGAGRRRRSMCTSSTTRSQTSRCSSSRRFSARSQTAVCSFAMCAR